MAIGSFGLRPLRHLGFGLFLVRGVEVGLGVEELVGDRVERVERVPCRRIGVSAVVL